MNPLKRLRRWRDRRKMGRLVHEVAEGRMTVNQARAQLGFKPYQFDVRTTPWRTELIGSDCE